MKESFILYTNYKEKFDLLNDEQLGKLIRSIVEYEITQENPTKGKLDTLTEMCFSFIKGDLDRSRAKYNSCVENGKRGGRPKSNKPKKTEDNPTKPNPNLDVDVDVYEDVDVYVPEDVIIKDSCSELKISLTLNDKSEYPIYQDSIKKWSELYPSVDVMQELRNMKGWVDANPTRRKTKRGVSTFINSWLSRKQDKSGNKQNSIDWG